MFAGNAVYTLHMQLAIPQCVDMSLNDEHLADIIEEILAVGLRPCSQAPLAARRFAQWLEVGLQDLCVLTYRFQQFCNIEVLRGKLSHL